MTFIIPNQQTKKHLQTNKNDLSGTIYQTRNISLDDEGYITLAQAPYAVMTTDDDANLDRADAIMAGESEVWVNSDDVFSGRIGVDTLSTHAADTNVPTPSVEDDVVYFNGTEVISDGVTIKYLSTSTVWTTISGTSLPSTATPTVMCVFGGANTLAVGKDNIVKFINNSWAVNATVLTLPIDFQVSSMASRGSSLYIGTRSKSGAEALMFTISTISSSATTAYGVGTFEIPSLFPFKSTVACIDSLGRLLQFTGGGFEELASLPIYATPFEWCDASNDYSTVSNRATSTDGDLIYINLTSYIQSGVYKMLPNFHSGIWCYDNSNRSLYHKYSPSYTRIEQWSGTAITVSAANDTFTATSGNLNNIITGMPVMYDPATTSIPELKESVCYYVIKVSSTVFKLASSYTDAIAGTAIDITGAGDTGQYFYFFKTNDYGWSFYDSRLSVTVLNNTHFDNSYSGRLAYTATLFSKQVATTDKTVIGTVSPFIPNRGYFITPRLNSSNIKDVYNSLLIKYKPLGVDEKIIVKYKTKDRKGFPFSSIQSNDDTTWVASWTDTDTFTTTVDLSDVVAGDEIEIVAGVGSGHIAHVSSISVNAGTYTVNLTEAFHFAVSGDKFYFNVDNFTFLTEITYSDQGDGFYSSIVDNRSKFVQFKVELRGVGVTIEEVQVSNKTDLKVRK